MALTFFCVNSLFLFWCSCLVFVCRPSVGPPAGQLIVPANSNLVPAGLGLRPECMLLVVSFFFYCLLFSSPFLSFFFLGVRTMEYVLGIIWFATQVARTPPPPPAQCGRQNNVANPIRRRQTLSSVSPMVCYVVQCLHNRDFLRPHLCRGGSPPPVKLSGMVYHSTTAPSYRIPLRAGIAVHASYVVFARVLFFVWRRCLACFEMISGRRGENQHT